MDQTAEKQRIEMIHNVGVLDGNIQIGGDSLRQGPVVIPPPLNLVVLDQLARNASTSEMLDGLHNRLAVGVADFHQDAVHVKHQQVVHAYQISFSSARN